MFALFLIFEILIGIAAIVGFWMCIYGLMDNNCWIFNYNYWENRSKMSELEKRIEKLEKGR